MEYKLKVDDAKKHYREYDITGEISVQNIDSLVGEMRGCISACDDLVINLVSVTGFDTAAFQFFYSLKNSFIRDKKKLKVNCELSQEATQLLANCGISDLASVLSIESGK